MLDLSPRVHAKFSLRRAGVSLLCLASGLKWYHLINAEILQFLAYWGSNQKPSQLRSGRGRDITAQQTPGMEAGEGSGSIALLHRPKW
jgi:hypothetical protein